MVKFIKRENLFQKMMIKNKEEIVHTLATKYKLPLKKVTEIIDY